MIKNIAVLAGDGIGPEVMKEAIKVLDVIVCKTGVTFNYTNALVGASAIDSENNPFPDSTKRICESSDAILFGAIGDPKYDNNPKAKIEGFAYSKELSEFGGQWGYEELAQFLYNPKEYIKGTKMNFAGLKKVQDRANLVLFLREQSDNPAPLP